jgi:hypothetical protein
MRLRLIGLLGRPAFWIILAPVILFFPVLFTGKALFWGTPMTQFAPWWMQAWESLLDGHLPLWNPWVGMGAPLLANYQSALLYPPTWTYFILYLIGGLPLMTWGMGVIVVLHIAWAGLGMSAIAREFGWGRVAQTISGLSFGLSGYLVARAHFLSINVAVAWLPWVILSGFKLVMSEGRRKHYFFNLVICIAFQLLAGHAQTTWYTMLLLGVWVAFWGWQRSGAWGWGRAWALLIGAGMWGIGLTAVQIFPTAEYLLQSQRATQVGYDFAMTYSFWPWRFLTFFFPNLFGNPAHGDYWGYAAYWEDSVYIGVLGILLALAVILKRGKTLGERRFIRFMVMVVVISFIFALGENTPVFPWLYRNIPGFDMFQAPTRFSIWSVFGLSLLAGMGFESWRRPEGRSLYWSRLAVAGAAAISIGAGIAWYLIDVLKLDLGDVKPTFMPAFALGGILVLGAGVLNLLAPERDKTRSGNLWGWCVLLFLTIDLVQAGWGLNPGIENEIYQQASPSVQLVNDLGAGQRVYFNAHDEYTLKYEILFVFNHFNVERDWMVMRTFLLPNTNIFDRVAFTNNYDPIVPARFQLWLKALEEAPTSVQAEMLERMGVSVVEGLVSEDPLEVNFIALNESKRARFATCTVFIDNGEQALEWILNGIDASGVVILEGVVGTGSVADCQTGDVQVSLEHPNGIVLSVSSEESGWLVLHDVWYPGWKVYVDGENKTVLRADYLFRAVEVPKGEHEVKFVYRPISLYAGSILSLVSLCMLLVFKFWERSNSGK